MKGTESVHPTGDHNNVQPEYGIDMRSYLSAMAMQSFLIANKGWTPEHTAHESIRYANALIKELNKQ
jgi:hypothetical protein